MYLSQTNHRRTLYDFSLKYFHCVKSVQIRSFFWSVFSPDWIRKDIEYLSVFKPNAWKYGPGKTPYLDTFSIVYAFQSGSEISKKAIAIGKMNAIMQQILLEGKIWNC